MKGINPEEQAPSHFLQDVFCLPQLLERPKGTSNALKIFSLT